MREKIVGTELNLEQQVAIDREGNVRHPDDFTDFESSGPMSDSFFERNAQLIELAGYSARKKSVINKLNHAEAGRSISRKSEGTLVKELSYINNIITTTAIKLCVHCPLRSKCEISNEIATELLDPQKRNRLLYRVSPDRPRINEETCANNLASQRLSFKKKS